MEMPVVDPGGTAGADLGSFRESARAALTIAAQAANWGQGPEGTSRARLRDVDRHLHRIGWAGLPIAVCDGGQGLTLRHQIVFLEEASAQGIPTPYNRVALGIVSPALTTFGTKQQRQRYMPALISCDEIWCQGFSEPEAGSDLASLRTRAVRLDDGSWVLNGQKIWTTLGVEARFCFILARTGTVEERHRGITAFIMPMDDPGVSIRPIAQINGDADFAEVFLSDVRLDADAVLGEVGAGWSVAMTALGYERSTHLLQRQARLERMIDDLVTSDIDLAPAADELLDLRLDTLAMHYAVRDAIDRLTGGGDVGVAPNATKVVWSETYQRLADLRVRLARLQRAPELAGAEAEYLTSLATSIYAGTNEIQRNIVAERGLGLPR
jgi:alkylation response protein AidB-like acyl-CoA dehydrogenase